MDSSWALELTIENFRLLEMYCAEMFKCNKKEPLIILMVEDVF